VGSDGVGSVASGIVSLAHNIHFVATVVVEQKSVTNNKCLTISPGGVIFPCSPAVGAANSVLRSVGKRRGQHENQKRNLHGHV